MERHYREFSNMSGNFLLVILLAGVSTCSAFNYTACSSYHVYNLVVTPPLQVTAVDTSINLDGHYYQSDSQPDKYVSYIGYIMCINIVNEDVTIKFSKIENNVEIKVANVGSLMLDGHNKCLKSSNHGSRICCSSDNEQTSSISYGSSASIGVMIFLAICIQIIAPGFHICCTKTCFKLCTRKNPSRLRIYSLYWWFMQMPWLVYLCVVGGLNSTGNGDYTTAVNTAATFFTISYVLILWESFTSHERQYISNVFSRETLAEHVASCRAINPRMFLWIKAWHYTEKTTHFTTKYYDEYGHKLYTDHHTKTYRIKHVTYKGTQEFDYDVSEDVSERIEDVEYLPGVTKIQFKLEVRYGDIHTSNEMLTQRKQMIERAWDVEYKVKDIEELPGMIKRLSVLNGEKRSFWMKEPFFWLATLICLTWPYRILYRNFTYKIKHTHAKVVYINPPRPRSSHRLSDVSSVSVVSGGHNRPTISNYSSSYVYELPYPYNMVTSPVANNTPTSGEIMPYYQPGPVQLGVPPTAYVQPYTSYGSAPSVPMHQTSSQASMTQSTDRARNQASDEKEKKNKKRKKSEKSSGGGETNASQPQPDRPPPRWSGEPTFHPGYAQQMQTGPQYQPYVNYQVPRASGESYFGESVVRTNPLFQD